MEVPKIPVRVDCYGQWWILQLEYAVGSFDFRQSMVQVSEVLEQFCKVLRSFDRTLSTSAKCIGSKDQ